MHVFNESNVFILFHFLWGCYGGALVFLGGAGAPASPSLAPPMRPSIFIGSVIEKSDWLITFDL